MSFHAPLPRNPPSACRMRFGNKSSHKSSEQILRKLLNDRLGLTQYHTSLGISSLSDISSKRIYLHT